jgi:hypothetical protein
MHPRVVLPFVVALLVALGVAVFDPIHIFFIESKIRNRFSMAHGSLEHSAIFGFIPSLVRALRSGLRGLDEIVRSNRHDDPEFIEIELDDFNGGDVQIPRLRSSFCEVPDSLFVITGPSGSGKSQLAANVTMLAKEAGMLLKIDCEAFVNRSHSDSDLIQVLANQVGYRPMVGWVNTLWSYLDSAMAATMGTKTGMSLSNESMVKHILDCVGVALIKLNATRKPGTQ